MPRVSLVSFFQPTRKKKEGEQKNMCMGDAKLTKLTGVNITI